MTVAQTLTQTVEKIAEKSGKAKTATKARVTELIMSGGACTGCVYEKGGASFKISASERFGAGFTSNSLLAMSRLDLLHFSTTNGEYCAGDVIRMGEAIGTKTIDLEWVQVHPTGLVKLDDPDEKNQVPCGRSTSRSWWSHVQRAWQSFLPISWGKRNYVTGEMWGNEPPFRLALNKAASDELDSVLISPTTLSRPHGRRLRFCQQERDLH